MDQRKLLPPPRKRKHDEAIFHFMNLLEAEEDRQASHAAQIAWQRHQRVLSKIGIEVHIHDEWHKD